MAVRHDEIERAGRRLVDGEHRLVLDHYARLCLRWELLGTGVDPRQAAGQALQYPRHFLADVPRAKQQHIEGVFFSLDFFHPGEGERGIAAAALTERVPEDELVPSRGLAGGEHLARHLHGRIFEVAAADGAAGLALADPHAGTRVARHGAARLNDPDFDVAHGSPSGCSRASPGLRAAPGRASYSSRLRRRRGREIPTARA